MVLKRRQLKPPRVTTGKERRWLDPNKGLFKRIERRVDILVSRYIYPHMLGVWNPYSRLLYKRFSLAEISISPPRWPANLPQLKVLLISDIHTGIFLKPEILSEIVTALMEVKPDLVAIAGDIVTGETTELDEFVPALKPLSRAPLGAWFCYGNHDYFGGDPDGIRERLSSIGITTLKNESAMLNHGNGRFVVGGIDEPIFGCPDWDQLLSSHGPPHLLLAHHPDLFYQAVARKVALTLSGHTHGGQIRPPWTPPLVRQSKYCLDEGAYAHNASVLVVSRGLGSVGLPLRYGADPEAVLILVNSP
jgi:predicted MPP superfamily phosphohydrolase